jgi:hypothetical protein
MKDDFFDDIKERIRFYIIPALFTLLIILLIFADYKADKKAWNNGFCSCGGRWEYVEDSHHLSYSKDSGYHDTKKYIYKCNKCGKMHEFNELR